MRVFPCKSHVAYEIRPIKQIRPGKHQTGIVIIRETGMRKTARDLWIPKNWRFQVFPDKPHWKWFIRLPFFHLIKNNCNLEIGHPNLFIWFIL